MKTWKIATTLFMGAWLVGCSNSGPKDAVKNFMENMAVQKVDEAKKYATERTHKLIDLATTLDGEIKPNYKFVFIKDSIVDQEAWVTFVDLDNDTTTTRVVRVDGKWLVDQPMGK
ncbi:MULTISPECIES: DUF4878 domain-containing protein [Bacteroidales]|uniref:Uncharacterized protein DUF4878 n=2 Tax=Porphyromonas loveana TaxID=1884669 RepID=A0A2U1F946_9PORP|nr:DUF4878 domain-containing protein [Porphyromonas loveana]PVZ08702.1 uncharacterized protein DUF4878 [Porphyromonas loveana]